MRSKSRDTSEDQRKLSAQRIQERRADLEKKGIPSKEFYKDKVYEHLKAKQRAITRAIAAIDAANARNKGPKETAAEPAAPVPAATKEKKPRKEKPEKAERAAAPKSGD